MFKFKGPFCQSCGMPISKDENGGGTEKNGDKTLLYCSHCYQNGEFTEPNLTVDEMVSKVKGKLKTMNIPALLAIVLTRNIPKLKRWRQ